MTKVHHGSTRTPSLGSQLKALEKKALNELKAQQEKADAGVEQLEQLQPEAKPQLEQLKARVDQKFSLERTAVEARFKNLEQLAQGLSPKPKPPSPFEKAVATVKQHFGELDTEAGIGKKDGIVSNLDLATALKDPKASKQVKDAAQYLLTHGKDFDALDTAGHGGKTDDRVSLDDLNAQQRRLAKPAAPKAHASKSSGKAHKAGKKKPSHPAAASGGVNKSKLPSNYRKYADEISAAAKKYHLPPAYIAAVMDRETGGRNILGDGGHGHGLMQIDDRSHGSWLRSHHNGLDPKSNIDYGCSILASNLKAAHQHGLSGDKALKFAASAYNAGLGGAEAGLRSGNSDARTTGHNYGSDVLKRMKKFEPGFSGASHAGSTKKAGHKKAHNTHATSGSKAVSSGAKKQMAALERAAKRYASGKHPMGWCLKKVEDYLQTVSYGKIGHGHIPRFPYAHQFADYLNAGHPARYTKLGLKKLNISNPYDAPPGAIIVVRAGTPGTHHPTAGDIVVKGHGSHFYNDGEMGYGGPGNFPKGNKHVLGIYVPA